MLTPEVQEEYYKALLTKDPNYDGIFYVGVKSTGIFCRSVCPARKPKFTNCEFFEKAEEALLASYRPCKRCQPLSHPDKVPEIVQNLLQAIEKSPEKRWKTKDFQELSTTATQASRLFKKRFGMTFVAYARALRMGIARKQIKERNSVIHTQIVSGYNSGSGFRDAFSKIMGTPPIKAGEIALFKVDWIDTPLGSMLVIGDEKALYLLEFVHRRGLEREIEKFRKKTKSAIVPGRTDTIKAIKEELTRYFKGQLTNFQTPIEMIGSPFQKRVWLELQKIPLGRTCSYTDIAKAIKNPQAIRAVGRANGANQLAIIIPCHRVINANGELGGYGGGLPRKRWLLTHERKHRRNKEHSPL